MIHHRQTPGHGKRPKSNSVNPCETRESLIRFAARTFGTQGYSATTMRNIADQAGIEAASIYYHFPSKEELVEAVMEQGAAHIVHHLNEHLDALSPDATAEQRFRAAVLGQMRGLVIHGDFAVARPAARPVARCDPRAAGGSARASPDALERAAGRSACRRQPARTWTSRSRESTSSAASIRSSRGSTRKRLAGTDRRPTLHDVPLRRGTVVAALITPSCTHRTTPHAALAPAAACPRRITAIRSRYKPQ